MADRPTLNTLLDALYQCGIQAEAVKLWERNTSSYDVADDVSRECERLSESIRDEMRALRGVA